MAGLSQLTIRGYKSIRDLSGLHLDRVNVLIGPNGAGKSNLLSFFNFLHALIEQSLELHVAEHEGGADACLHLGRKTTPSLSAEFQFGQNRYAFSLAPTIRDGFVFHREVAEYRPFDSAKALGKGHRESRLRDLKDHPGALGHESIEHHIYRSISSWVTYHFHDTSASAAVKRRHAINDDERLRGDGANLASILFRLRETAPKQYARIRDLVRLAAPFFDDFLLRPITTSPDDIQLEWRQQGSDYPFRAHHLSDGTLRFICLITALLQPRAPATIVIDEPELGLHPFAVSMIGNLLKASRSQVVVATQSVQLLDEMDPEDIIVAERVNGESTFHRLSSANLSGWLEEHSLGEMWQKNVLGGRPRLEDTVPVTEH